jgi:hypothetical protein
MLFCSLSVYCFAPSSKFFVWARMVPALIMSLYAVVTACASGG